ncbi:DUF4205-containing protein [Aureococcus anophagefferens]|nr:DUF4205-containing protein [Aureococcus anophagefferens]
MGGDEWWLGSELRALLEAQAAEKAEQGCEKAACPTAAEAPEKAEKGPPAPAPAPVSAARRAPGAPWDDVDDALEAVAAEPLAVPATAQGLVRPVPVTFQSVVNSYVHWLEEHPTIGVAVCKMSRSKRKPHRSRERKELLEDGCDESQDRLVSHGLTGRMYKLVVRGRSPKPDAPGEAPPAPAPELPAGPRVRCEKPTRGGACEALEGSSIVQIFVDEAAARFVGPARSRPAPRPFRPPPPADYPTPRRFAVPAEASYGGTGYGYDAPRLAAYYAEHFPTRGAAARRGPTAPRRSAPRAPPTTPAAHPARGAARPQRRGAAHLRQRAGAAAPPGPAACYSHPYVVHRPGIISQVPLRPGDPAGQAAAGDDASLSSWPSFSRLGDVDDDSWPSFSHLGDAADDPLLTHLDDVVDDSLLKADAIDDVLLSLQKPFI